MHQYLARASEALRCVPLAVGGVEDHVHVLVRLASDVAVSTLVRELKAPSSLFAKRTLGVRDFTWQQGYGAFSLREAEVERVRRYVARQEIAHAQGRLSLLLERTE